MPLTRIHRACSKIQGLTKSTDMQRICLYYIPEPAVDRWLPGDRYVRPLVRRIVRGKGWPSGVDKVFINLCLGLDKLSIPYEVNPPFRSLEIGDMVGILGRGRNCLRGYDRPVPIVAGIGLMTYPPEWPDLCERYPVVRYAVASDWINDVYKQYFGDRCTVWPVGIDTDTWRPAGNNHKSVDFLIYNKIQWNYEYYEQSVLAPVRETLNERGISYRELRYMFYRPEDYAEALANCRAMIFICEHETQGLAYQECLSSGVPIIAWDEGTCKDPDRLRWGFDNIPSTSVPYWDERCGVTFKTATEFPAALDEFLTKAGKNSFDPRGYVLETLSLERRSSEFVGLLKAASECQI